MSLFPSAPDIFVDRTGADNIASSDPNNAYDAIENIENFIGASGQPQSKSITLLNLFRGMFSPVPQCSWVNADTIAILPSQAVLYSTDNFVIKRNTSIFTCHLSTDIDTGSEESNVWYDLYLLGDGSNSQYTAKFVLAGSTPYGMSYYKKINSFRNDGSGNILKFYQSKDYVAWDIPVLITTDPSVDTWSGSVSCTLAMPSITNMGRFGVAADRAGDKTIGIFLRPNGAVYSSGLANALMGMDGGGNAATCYGAWGHCITDAEQCINHYDRGIIDNFELWVQGYYIDI